MKLIAFFLLFSPLGMTKETYPLNPQRDAVLKEIKDTFGLVPKFYEQYPAEGVAGAWNEMRSLQLNPKTALSGLDKELIGLGVASQIPCHYCGYFHTQAAKLNGGNDRQIKEAIAQASITRFWGAFFDGMQIDKKEFMKETDKIVKIQKERMEPGYKAPELPPINVIDADTAYQDMERNLGIVPFFVKQLPKNSVAGVWNTIKGIQFNPATALSGKLKNLIALAVAGQSSCKHCVYWTTEMAKLNGATEQEIAEAVEMAGTTRFWSTWLNGNRFDEKAFKKEADKIFAHLKKQSNK